MRGATAPDVTKEPKSLIIKVQVPVPFELTGRTPATSTPPAPSNNSNGALAVYTKKRDFVCYIKRAEQDQGGLPYDQIADVVKTKGVGGVKAYFAAELRSEDELVVKISEVLAEQPF
ncbi:hypothetical protein D9758_005800 [Tetrapyrgos nigripes]|uniref:Uncharacterized protein n=1 Tax=Tetrapyrgos nigripes TaxID=182062 RepID=A0A8H5GJJ9_9AGAR|nr:hypothetical protein D9758_005800 [Tetrapyrgos nigripes]